MLKFELNVEERKTLAKRMEELTGIHPYYTKAPRYAYDIGNYTIDRDGNLLVEAENADLELLTTPDPWRRGCGCRDFAGNCRRTACGRPCRGCPDDSGSRSK